MGRLTQIAKLPSLVGEARRIASAGWPKRVRVLGVGQPEGLIIPRSTVSLEVASTDGTKTRLEPTIPIPFPYAWGYRLFRRLGVPVISSRDPENLKFSVTLPRFTGPTR